MRFSASQNNIGNNYKLGVLIMKLTIALIFALLLTSTFAHAAGDAARGNELSVECIDCHGEDGMGDDEYPQIAGRDESYLFEQLMAFKTGKRPNRAEMMLWSIEDLDEQDLADLAAYYASLASE